VNVTVWPLASQLLVPRFEGGTVETASEARVIGSENVSESDAV